MDRLPTEPATYMVRAVKLERSSSGTYLNASQGVFISISTTSPPASDSILSIRPAGQGSVQLRINGREGNSCTVEFSPDLGVWNPLATNVLSDNFIEFIDAIPAGAKHGFYRARLSQ